MTNTGSEEMTRRNFLHACAAGAGGLALASGAGAMARADGGRKPNIVFILADDLGYGDVGCYGQKRIKTPVLDRMASDGLKFTDSYAGSTVCAPSRCVLMTGLHTGHCWVRGNGKGPAQALRDEDVTVAELLKKAGYATGLAGKWGLGDDNPEAASGLPTRQGFDFFFGYLNQHHAHNYYPTFLIRNETRVKLPNVVPDEGEFGQGVAAEKVQYSHTLIMDEALKFIERSKGGPFFLYLASTLPHANNEAKDKGMEVPDYGIYKNLDWPEPQKGHAAMITLLDAGVGDVLAKLKDLGIDKDTLVIFTSDNGPHKEGGNDAEFNRSSGPLQGTKRSLYDGGIRVPMIAYWPGTIAPGKVTDHVACFQDFLPTACEMAGIAPPKDIDGLSYLPTLLGQADRQKQHEYLYWEFHEGGDSSQAVRMGPWKAVRKSPGGPIELYDVTADIHEDDDVASKHGDVVARAAEYMKAARVDNPFWKLKEAPAGKKGKTGGKAKA